MGRIFEKEYELFFCRLPILTILPIFVILFLFTSYICIIDLF